MSEAPYKQEPITGFPSADPRTEKQALIDGLEFGETVEEELAKIQVGLIGDLDTLVEKLKRRLKDLVDGQSPRTLNHILDRASEAIGIVDFVNIAKEGTKALSEAVESARPPKPVREPKSGKSAEGTTEPKRRGRPKGSGSKSAEQAA